MALLCRDGRLLSFLSPLTQSCFATRSYGVRCRVSSLAIICALVVSRATRVPKTLRLFAIVCSDVVNRFLVCILAEQRRLGILTSTRGVGQLALNTTPPDDVSTNPPPPAHHLRRRRRRGHLLGSSSSLRCEASPTVYRCSGDSRNPKCAMWCSSR